MPLQIKSGTEIENNIKLQPFCDPVNIIQSLNNVHTFADEEALSCLMMMSSCKSA
jgi:hypothetical protein